MKYHPLILSLLLVFFFSCDTPDDSFEILLKGVIGNDLDSRILLDQDGDIFLGFFYYENNPNERIKISGVRYGENLRLYEFNNESNRLTGIFEGKFDGNIFEGTWMNPRKTQRVPFSYFTKLEKDSDIDLDQDYFEKEKPKIVIEYIGSGSFGSSFNERLKAKVNGTVHRLLDFNEHGIFVKKFAIKDFNNNGFDDILVIETCGGTACPLSHLIFITYDERADRFIISESFGSFSKTPEISKWNDRWSVELVSMGRMQRVEERYIFENRYPKRIEYKRTQSIDAIFDFLPGDFNEEERNSEKRVEFDLNGDGRKDVISGEYWWRWNLIWKWKIDFANGKTFEGDGAAERIGVLESRTNGVHDLVIGIDEIWVWNGSTYVKK